MSKSTGKIVFAEDNISIVKIVINKLSLDGYEVFHFPNSEFSARVKNIIAKGKS